MEVHHKLPAVKRSLPKEKMTLNVQPFTFEDVPFLVLTFSSNEIDDFILGGCKRSIRVIVDPGFQRVVFLMVLF